MKKIIASLVILSVLFTGVIIKITEKEGSQLIFEAFNQSTFQPVQSNINTYAILKEPLKNFEDMEKYMKIVEEKIGADIEDDIIKEETDEVKTLEKIYMSPSAKLTTTIETINSQNSTSYLVIDIILYDYYENIIQVKEQIDNVFNSLKLDVKTNISITGAYSGKMSYNEKKVLAFDIMKKMNATAKEDYITDKIYSVVGYTKRINEYIYSEKQKININLALRYNEYENRTYLYLATPVITVEY